MKKITLPKILECLENESNEIIIPNNLMEKAKLSVERMTSIGR
jgi:quinolinate synthase